MKQLGKERKALEMRNKYPGNCIKCNARVEAGEGFPEIHGGRWGVRCLRCVEENQEKKAQRNFEKYREIRESKKNEGKES